MAKKKVQSKLGITDIAAAWKAGWTPGDVNALLDRLDDMGDMNSPEENDDPGEEDDEEDEDLDLDDEDQDESDEDEDDTDSDATTKKASEDKKKNSDSISLLESENKRLKKQLEKLQTKNRNKDVSGDSDNKKSCEQSLIDTVQSLFD